MEFGLALSGGGLRGGAHIGVLKALEEERLYPSWISGTSAGSIVAGLYTCGYSPKEIEEIALNFKKNIYDPDITGIITSVFRLIIGKEPVIDGIIKGNRIEKIFKKLTKGRKIKDSKIPTAITGVDINNGKTIYFVSNKKGLRNDKHNKYIDNVEIYKAIRASIAIPVVFQLSKVSALNLVDGGVTDSLPGKVLKLMGAKRVIGVNLGYSGQMRKNIDNFIEVGGQSLNILEYQITSLKNTHTDLVLNPHIYDVGLNDFEKTPECIERGYKAAKKNMYKIKRVIYK